MPKSIITTTEEALLALFHLSSATFPIGTFSHSFGLETYVAQDRINDIQSFQRFLQAILETSLGYLEAPAASLAHGMSPEELADLDRLITALKPTREFRSASEKTGRAFLRLFNMIYPDTLLGEYAKWVRDKVVPGNYCVIFGCGSGILGVDKKAATLSFLFSSVNSLVQAGVKLIPLGQGDSQKLLRVMHEDILQNVNRALALRKENLSGFAPALDIASMQHENLYTRLYMS